MQDRHYLLLDAEVTKKHTRGTRQKWTPDEEKIMREELDITPGMAVLTRNHLFEFHKKEKKCSGKCLLAVCVHIHYLHIIFIVSLLSYPPSTKCQRLK